MVDLSYSAGALAEGIVFRGIQFAAESEDVAFRGLVFASEPPTEKHFYASGVGKKTVSSPYSASAVAKKNLLEMYDSSAYAVFTLDLEYDASSVLLQTVDLDYQSSTILLQTQDLEYLASARGAFPSIDIEYEASALLLSAPNIEYQTSVDLLGTEELEYQFSGNLLATYESEYQASARSAFPPIDIEYEASSVLLQEVDLDYLASLDVLATEDLDYSSSALIAVPYQSVSYEAGAWVQGHYFRGFSFATETEDTAFRGIEFSAESEDVAFRGITFSVESSESSSPVYRGLIFGYEPPAEQFYQASAVAMVTMSLPYLASASAKGTVGEEFFASAVAALAGDVGYLSSVNILSTTELPYSASMTALATVNLGYSGSADLFSIVDSTYSASSVCQMTVDQSYTGSVIGQATVDEDYFASVIGQATISSPYEASSVCQDTVTIQNSASAVAAYRHSLLKSHEISVSAFDFVPAQGSSSGYSANNPNTLFAWIVDDAGTNRLYGRLDNPEMEEAAPGHVPAMEISTETGMEGVKVCHFRTSNRWAVVWKRGTDIKYRIFDSSLTPVTGDVTITTSALSFIVPDHFDIGCTDAERLVVLAADLKIIDVDTPATVTQPPFHAPAIFANKMAVHRISGAIDVLVLDGADLKVDRYDAGGNFLITITVATSQSGMHPLWADIVSCQNNDSFLVAWIADDELRYRLYDATGLAQTAILTIAGASGLSAGGRSFSATVGNQEDYFSFLVKAASDDYSFLAWIRTDLAMSQVLETQLIFLSDDQSSPTPVNGVNEFHFRHIYEVGGEMVHEVYVNSSVYMGLWRIERDNRSFVNTVSDADPYLNRDGDSASLIDGVFSGYVGGNRLSGSEGADGTDYTSAPGRGAVDLDNANFDDFLGTVDEDTFLIGGPIHSEVASSMQMNSNMFASQINYLSSELGITSVSFIDFAGSPDGLQYGANAPGIEVVNGNGTFQLHRHLTMGGDAVDYAIILRLAMEPDSTQADLPQNKSFWYAAGITTFSTEAAANAIAFPVEFRLGQSSALLVIITYPEGTTSYVPGITPGTVTVVPLRDVNSDDFVL